MARCLYRVIKSCTHARVNWAKASAYRPGVCASRFNNRGASRRASWHASSSLIYDEELFFRRIEAALQKFSVDRPTGAEQRLGACARSFQRSRGPLNIRTNVRGRRQDSCKSCDAARRLRKRGPIKIV